MALVNIHHLAGATRYSLAGLKRAWQGEQAFRHEVLVLCAMPFLLVLLSPGAAWCAAAVAGWLFVMGFELLNSAIEEAFDLITKERNDHVKFGKDMASAAIFLALVANGVLWVCMLWAAL